MEPEIKVYDDKNNQIGKTFARRAKQLIAKGRATWVDDSQAAVILSAGADVSEIYAPNDGNFKDLRYVKERIEDDDSDDFLRRLAAERVRHKKALRWHVAGFFAVLFFTPGFFAIVTNGFWRVMPIGWIMLGFCCGMIATWGIWIGRRITELWRERSLRPHDVEREFQRLKYMQSK